MVPKENENNAYAKFGGTNKEYYGVFRSGLLNLNRLILIILKYSKSHYLSANHNREN